MKQHVKLFISMVGVIFITSSAYCGDYSSPAVSLGIGGSLIFEQFDTGMDELSFDESFGLNIKAGYRFTEHFEGVVDYILIDGFDGEVYGVEALELSGYAITLNGKYYPFIGRIQPYGLLGIGLASMEIKDTLGFGLSESETDTVLRAGAGIDISVSNHLTLFTEISYYLTQGDIEDTDFIPLTAGVKFTF